MHGEADERKSSYDSTRIVTRRHQIPGLRQTPYLKIFLLRCDDSESYKATARKALREWVKTHTSQSSGAAGAISNNQEKHDAFGWLIVHVEQDPADVHDKSGAAASSSSKWSSRSGTSVLEKVKADFNPSSKAAVDRVAQLRLPAEFLSSASPPSPVAAVAVLQRSPELSEQLDDLVEKLKNGVLASFDLRVMQYEEDIKEKDSQRNLPGWNFCTFFILKEGLARGFENVGLFEDALVGYDQLSVGLDAAIREQLLENGGEQAAGALLEYSKDWKEIARRAYAAVSARLQNKGGGGGDGGERENRLQINQNDREDEDEGDGIPQLEPDDFPFNANKKPYRDMILSNDISIFDFRIYVFSRQLTLLLRAARAPSLALEEELAEGGADSLHGNSKKRPEDLLLLSEVCERANEFVGIGARTLLYSLECCLEDVDDSTAKSEVLGNLVSSWAYSAASQVLTQTSTPLLSLPESPLHSAIVDIRPAVPRRSSSLITTPSGGGDRGLTRPTSQEILSADLDDSIQRAWANVVQKTGSEQLASSRGQLYYSTRRFLEEIAGRCGWTATWNELGLLFDDESGQGHFQDVSLDDNDDGGRLLSSPESRVSRGVDTETETSVRPLLSCIQNAVLTSAFKSKGAYMSRNEKLTDQVLRHFVAAGSVYSVEMAIADLAFLKFRQTDYATAASYFNHVAPFYGNKHWTLLEGVMLEMYARCLQELKRNEEHARAMLRLLAKYAAYEQAKLSSRERTRGLSPMFTEDALVSKYVEQMFTASKALTKEISAPFADFFADLHFEPAVLHYPDKDGFRIQFSLRYLLGRQISVSSIKLRLVNVLHPQNNEHWIENSGSFLVKSSATKLVIDSSVGFPFARNISIAFLLVLIGS